MMMLTGGRKRQLQEIAQRAREERDEKRRKAVIPLDEVEEPLRKRIQALVDTESVQTILDTLHDTSDRITATAMMIVLCDRARYVQLLALDVDADTRICERNLAYLLLRPQTPRGRFGYECTGNV